MICDISKHQGKIDWDKLAPNLDLVFIKASGKYENNGDPQYVNNVNGAVSHKVPFYVYHFLYCLTEEEARRDARLFYQKVKDAGHEPLGWVLDCEAEWGIQDDKAAKIAGVFEDELRKLAGKDIRVGLYVAHQKYNVWKMDYPHYYFIWIPKYGKGSLNDGTLEHSSKPDHPCDIWQYTSKGKLPGIDGDVDLDILNGDKPLEYFIGDAKKAGEVEEGFTGKKLAQFCLDVYNSGNWVYWYGTYGSKCSESIYNSKKKQYPSHYESNRTSGYMKDIQNGRWCADCVGLIKAYFWKNGDITATPKYGSNNCPDKSANGMIEYCSETGPISTIPDEPGLVVWKSGHIGVYVGDGYTVEMKGFDYDCKKVKVTSGPWTKWGRLPKSMISYTGESVKPTSPTTPSTPSQEPSGLKRGDKGSAVKMMQKCLLKWNPNCLPRYGADGDFGSETETAVMNYQAAMGLPVTGIYDEETKKSLENQNGSQEPSESKYVEVTGNYVNVREEPNMNGRIYGVVRKGDRYEFLGEVSDQGWNRIKYNNSKAWISGKYSTIVKG